jgi:hypothetical protein
MVEGREDTGRGISTTIRSLADTGVSGSEVLEGREQAETRLEEGPEARGADRGEDGDRGKQIDPLTLPYAALSESRYLPTCAGIYFAIKEGGEVAYIGQSLNIRHRWRSHPVAAVLREPSDLEAARRIRVAWLAVEDIGQINQLERALIRQFRPRLNDTYNSEPKQQRPRVEIRVKSRSGLTRRAYMDRLKALTPRALEGRALVLAERLINARRVTKPAEGKSDRIVIGYVWRDEQGAIHRIRGKRLEPNYLRDHGYIEKARQILLRDYKLVEELPPAMCQPKAEKPGPTKAAKKGGAAK